MKTRAAVAFAAKQAFEIVGLDPEGLRINTAFDLTHQGKAVRSVVVF